MKIPPEQCKTQADVDAAYHARDAEILARYLNGESLRSLADRFGILHTSVRFILRRMGQRFVRAPGMSEDERQLRNRVRSATRALVEKGEIAKLPCEVCGYERAECHHERYDEENPGKWIRWLCKFHHVERHNELGWRRSPPIDSAALANAEPEETTP